MAAEKESVEFQSSRFGLIEVPTEAVFTVLGGMIGFPAQTSFVILEYNPPFSWMHSTEDPELAFVVVNAAEFGEGYIVDLPLDDPELCISDSKNVSVINVVSVRSNAMLTTVNLKAPVIVNTKNRIGRQIILESQQYSTKTPLFVQEEGDDSVK